MSNYETRYMSHVMTATSSSWLGTLSFIGQNANEITLHALHGQTVPVSTAPGAPNGALAQLDGASDQWLEVTTFGSPTREFLNPRTGDKAFVPYFASTPKVVLSPQNPVAPEFAGVKRRAIDLSLA